MTSDRLQTLEERVYDYLRQTTTITVSDAKRHAAHIAALNLAARQPDAAPVVQVPEGWRLDSLLLYPEMNGANRRDTYVARLFRADGRQQTAGGEGAEWQEALRAAIEQAKGET